VEWRESGPALFAGLPGDGWTTLAGILGACATLGGFLLRTRPQVARWIWGIFTANVRAALLEREVQDLREQVDRLYEDRKRERDLSDGRTSPEGSSSSPGSSISPSNPGRKPRTP
jgi:hypothetical protein